MTGVLSKFPKKQPQNTQPGDFLENYQSFQLDLVFALDFCTDQYIPVEIIKANTDLINLKTFIYNYGLYDVGQI